MTRVLAMLSLMALESVLSLASQSLQQPRLNVRKVIPAVDVVIEIQTGRTAAFLPYCGETEFGTPILCLRSANVEVLTKQGWQAVSLRSTDGVLIESHLGRAGGKTVPPDTKASVVLQFSRRYLDVQVGQRLRVMVEVWPDEKAVNRGEKARRLASPAFDCPEAGTGGH